MGLESVKAHIQHLFPENKLKTKRVKQKTQHRVASSAGRISEGLQRNKPSKRNVKKINNSGYQVGHQFFAFGAAKVLFINQLCNGYALLSPSCISGLLPDVAPRVASIILSNPGFSRIAR
jgi:regulator of replication initiation timing